MPEYARVENGAVVEIRQLDGIPSHKASLWTPVERVGSGSIEQTTVDGNVVRIIRSDPALATIKAQYKALVSEDAEKCRLRFITPGAGKAMSYQEKLAEARLVLDDPAAVTSELVPILAAEAAARGITVQQAAELVHGTYRAFKAVEAQINATAILATKAISDASDAAAARAAYEAITWPQQTP